MLAAEQTWPTARYVATDIDQSAVRRLGQIRPSWTVGRCNLRNPRSRQSCQALKGILKSTSVLLLNPPFTCRGGTKFVVQTSTGPLHASTAISFLLHTIDYIDDNGHIACVLPFGCLHNQKDGKAWEYLKSRYSIETLRRCPKGTFPTSAAETVLVRLSPKPPNQQTTAETEVVSVQNTQLPIRLIRGSCPISRKPKESSQIRLVHYTDIHSGNVKINSRRGSGQHKCVQGPAILLPRVGALTRNKIALLSLTSPVMLSDCLIALKPASDDLVIPLKEKIITHFSRLRSQYVGTGAPFITLDRLRSALKSMGVTVVEPT